MDYPIRTINGSDLPVQLYEIPEPPERLYVAGLDLPGDAHYLGVVGSRTHTNYGANACAKIIAGLAGHPIVIVSGLALGIDSVAHRAALKAGLKTVAFPGSGLSEKTLYPASNLSLAKEILAAGGSLVSEFEPSFKATPWSFPRRNRLIAGLCQAVLVVEAAPESGTLITARLALDYNKEILAVPGPITSQTSFGSNLLLRQGATLIQTSRDILEVFGLVEHEPEDRELPLDLSDDERVIIEILREPISRDDLILEIGKPAHEVNIILSALEIKGLIKEEYGEIRMI